MSLPPASWTVTNPSRRWGIISVTLLLVAGVCLWVGLRGHEVLLTAPARHPSSPATSSTLTAPAGAEVTAPVAGRSVPVSLRIPAIGIAVAGFVVTSVAMYPKDQFPSQQVYGSHGNSALQLVTCGGTFDSLTRSYLSNIVVYTSLRAMIPPGGSR